MNKQAEVERYLSNAEDYTAKLSEILIGVPFGYYHNGPKHLGAMMSRMVKNGSVTRIKKGVYEWNPPPRIRRRAVPTPDPDQTKMKI